MRPKFRILDRMFSARVKDGTSILKINKSNTHNEIISSCKVYEFKKALPYEEDEQPIVQQSLYFTRGYTDTATTGPVEIYATNHYTGTTGCEPPSHVTIGVTW